MILLYSILALIATLYLIISAIVFFNKADEYRTYEYVYKWLPEMKFLKSKHNSIIYCTPFMYDFSDGYLELDGDICLFRGNHEYFNLYGWYYRVKFEKWIAENVDIDNLEQI